MRQEFRSRYFEELRQCEELVAEVRNRAAKRAVTLVFAAKDAEHSNAVALRDYLQKKR